MGYGGGLLGLCCAMLTARCKMMRVCLDYFGNMSGYDTGLLVICWGMMGFFRNMLGYDGGLLGIWK